MEIVVSEYNKISNGVYYFKFPKKIDLDSGKVNHLHDFKLCNGKLILITNFNFKNIYIYNAWFLDITKIELIYQGIYYFRCDETPIGQPDMSLSELKSSIREYKLNLIENE